MQTVVLFGGLIQAATSLKDSYTDRPRCVFKFGAAAVKQFPVDKDCDLLHFPTGFSPGVDLT